MKKRIALFTTTRAEFGILNPLIRTMNRDEEIEPVVFVGGAHLSRENGRTLNEILESNVKVSGTFDLLLNDDDSFTIAKSCSIAGYELSHIFKNNDIDFVCVLGDRIELLPIVSSAIIFNKPIIHISGGEITEGAIDDQIRNMVSKAAHLHFVSCDEYARNLQAIGEEKRRIFNTGSLNVDNMIKIRRIPKAQLFDTLGIETEMPTILMTYHPVTNERSETIQKQMRNLFGALDPYDFQVVITSPNIDEGRNEILSIIEEMVSRNRRYYFFHSLGTRIYQNLISFCRFVIGNSSSGITEVPFYKIPTVNIGDRQKGRIRHASVIDTGYSAKEIKQGIEIALSSSFRKSLTNLKFKFGEGNAAEKITNIIKNVKISQELMRKKMPDNKIFKLRDDL